MRAGAGGRAKLSPTERVEKRKEEIGPAAKRGGWSPGKRAPAQSAALVGVLFRFAGHGDEADREENLAPDPLGGSAQADQILVPLPQRKNHPPALTQLVDEWLGDVAGGR